METYKLAISPGDSVGEELTAQLYKLFRTLEQVYPVRFELFPFASCAPAVQEYGTALREADLAEALGCRAVVLGNIGATAGPEREKSPVYALSSLRAAFQVCTNIRPAYASPVFESLSPLKSSITRRGIDILVVRDLMGGMIAGQKREAAGAQGLEASDLEYYNEQIVAHSAHFAFTAAQQRRKKVTSVDKANVLASSRLWRQKVSQLHAQYPGVSLENDFVDHAAMELLTAPDSFDVLLTSNVFGDILADEVAQITGAPWMFGSAELAQDGRGVYTPNQLHHPRGEQLAGKGQVCPYGIVNTAALLLRYSCGRPDLAEAVERAVEAALQERLFTAEALPDGAVCVSTEELGSQIAANIKEEKNNV